MMGMVMTPFNLIPICSMVVLFFNTAVAQESTPKITISKETTWIVSPLRPDGRIDYVEALNQQLREGVTTENNSVVMFRRALGHRGMKAPTTDEYFRQLGIEVLPKDGQYLLDLDDFLDSLKPSTSPAGGVDRDEQRRSLYKQCNEARSRPWTRDEFPLVARWIDANDAPLKLVIEGTKRTKYFAPLLPAVNSSLAAFSSDSAQMREAAELLAVRAMLNLGEGRLEDAWSDVLAIHRLARLIAPGPGIVGFLIGSAIESFVSRCDAQIAHQHTMNAEFAARCLREFEQMEVIDGLAERMDVDGRYEYLDTIQFLSLKDEESLRQFNFGFYFGGDRSLAEFVRSRLIERDLDVDRMLKIGNQWFDRYAKAARLPTRTARTAEIEKLDKEWQAVLDELKNTSRTDTNFTREESSRIVAIAFLSVPFSIVKTVFDTLDSCAMRTELSYCGFALAAWRADHGQYPDELAQLSPTYLKTIPIDRFNGQPLTYRRSEVGYLLYSVGVNLQGDGGVTGSDAIEINGREADDIAVRTPDEDLRIKAMIKEQRLK